MNELIDLIQTIFIIFLFRKTYLTMRVLKVLINESTHKHDTTNTEVS